MQERTPEVTTPEVSTYEMTGAAEDRGAPAPTWTSKDVGGSTVTVAVGLEKSEGAPPPPGDLSALRLSGVVSEAAGALRDVAPSLPEIDLAEVDEAAGRSRHPPRTWRSRPTEPGCRYGSRGTP